MSGKVFCIGFHKTGTSSMGEVLRTLGYNWYNYRQNPEMVQQLVKGDYTLAKKVAATHSAFEDDPWPSLYQQLDQWHPGSKFILTIREPQQWLTSVSKYFTNSDSVWRTHLYGHSLPQGHEQEYLSLYTQHCREVQLYFQDRPQDLLVVDITKEPSWTAICQFLGKAEPPLPFPHVNARR